MIPFTYGEIQENLDLKGFEWQYISDVIYFLFLLFETNVLSYLPPLYHNFENLTLYGNMHLQNLVSRKVNINIFKKKIISQGFLDPYA